MCSFPISRHFEVWTGDGEYADVCLRGSRRSKGGPQAPGSYNITSQKLR